MKNALQSAKQDLEYLQGNKARVYSNIIQYEEEIEQ